eukprot:gene25745-11406_t
MIQTKKAPPDLDGTVPFRILMVVLCFFLTVMLVSGHFLMKRMYGPPAKIPRVLWQTYKIKPVPRAAQKAVSTWRDNNPAMAMHLYDDEQVREFLEAHFEPSVLTIYDTFPLGVMKADFWRYAVLYIEGGVYSDIDTVCHVPVKQWLPPSDRAANGLPLDSVYKTQLTWDSCELVVGIENDDHFCQWTFASVAGHPLLNHTIHMSLERAKEGYDHSDKHMVHYITGPSLWTSAITTYLGFDSNMTAKKLFTLIYSHEHLFLRMRERGVCIVSNKFFWPLNVENLFGSWSFSNEENWTSWTDQAESMRYKADRESKKRKVTLLPRLMGRAAATRGLSH